MGVPVFFKWLSTRNPKIVKDAIQPQIGSYSAGNPLVDNFYIDMNGLIHPSCNPKGENIKIPNNFQQQCDNIYQYIDKLMNIVRPRKTLYLAIDGVAPRAKMNQQRSRRFRAAVEEHQKQVKRVQLLDKFKQVGAWSQQLQQYVSQKKFDSNMITPGTEFLSSVCLKLKQYIKDRLQNHPQWKNLIVIFSDANCPGEGQHKIMDFIRQERSSQQYTPDQSYCIYGADADLIMLSLATHQPKFYIIRQVVITQNDKFCTNCQRKGHYFMDCQQADSIEDEARVAQEINAKSVNVKFQFIRIQMVRQFIHINYMRSIIPFGYNLERIIDDFVFLCFFVGNDFLPHIPCLSIRQGGIDVLMKVYDYCLSIMPDYITKGGELNMKSLKIFIDQMTVYQDSLVRQMIIRQANAKQRQINNRNTQQRQKNRIEQQRKGNQSDDQQIDYKDPINSFKSIMQKMNKDTFNIDDYSVFNHELFQYKQKYYRQKFKIIPGQFLQLKNNISRSYVEALKWICAYYYKGVPSWSWFYPFHYSPFFTDINVPQEGLPQFDRGSPFKPFEQLMAVLPPRTCDALPKFLHYYMKDIQSPIIDYYPSNFHIDLVGKKFAWLGQVILPFIDDLRLLKALRGYEKKLNQQQSYRNRLGDTYLYINRHGHLGRRIKNNFEIKQGALLQLSWEKGHDVEGSLRILKMVNETIEFIFVQPQNRQHKVQLIEGTNNNPLEEIDDAFISRTDRGAYGGIRYTRLVENILYQRKQKFWSTKKVEDNKEDRNQTNYNRHDQGYYNRGKYYNSNPTDRRQQRGDRNQQPRRYQNSTQKNDRNYRNEPPKRYGNSNQRGNQRYDRNSRYNNKGERNQQKERGKVQKKDQKGQQQY